MRLLSMLVLASLWVAAATARGDVPRSGTEIIDGVGASSSGHVAVFTVDPAAVRLADPGQPFGDPLAIPQEQFVSFQTVAVGAEGQMLAVWSRGGLAEHSLYASFRPAGGTFEPAVEISDDQPGGEQVPVAEFDASGAVTVAWTREQHDDLAVRTRAADGTWGDPEAIAAPNAFRPGLAVADDGSVVLAVTTRRNPRSERNDVVVATRPAGGSFSAPQRLNGASDAAAVVVAGNDVGDAAVLWDAADEGDRHNRILGSFRSAGGSFGAARRISGPGGVFPSVSVGADGRTVMSWSRNPYGAIYARTGTATGGLQPIRTLTHHADVNAGSAALATDPATVSWYDKKGPAKVESDGRTLRTARFDATGQVVSRSRVHRFRSSGDTPIVFASPTELLYLIGDRILRRPL